MSHDTQVKQESPERIWINELPKSGRVAAYISPIREVGTEKSLSLAEYVRADLLATVRREEREAAFKEIRERIEAVNPSLTFGSANGSMMKKCILTEITALEASATEKGEVNG